MKNKLPVFIILTITIGLITFLIFYSFFIKSLNSKTVIQKESNIQKVEYLVIENQSNKKQKNDSIFVYNNTIKLSTKDKSQQTELEDTMFLNFFPKTLLYIFFHSMYVSFAMVISLIMLFFFIRMISEYQFNIRDKDFIWALFSLAILITTTIITLEAINLKASRLYGGAKIMKVFSVIFKDPLFVLKILATTLSVIALIPLTSIAFINTIANRIVKLPRHKNKKAELVNLRGYLNIIAFGTGLIVAGTIIGTSIQREMIAEHLINVNLIYPDEFIAIYGASFSFILALFFLPSLLFIKYCEREVLQLEGGKNENTSWFKIGKDSIKEIEIVFSIFLPLLISIIDYFIKL